MSRKHDIKTFAVTITVSIPIFAGSIPIRAVTSLRMRWLAMMAVSVWALAGATHPAAADPFPCNETSCVPGINRVVELGAYCSDDTYYVFATTTSGRVVFCGSAKGLAPRYFRAMPLVGIRDYNAACDQPYTAMAQAPDGMFLLCAAVLNPDGSGESRWVRGDEHAERE